MPASTSLSERPVQAPPVVQRRPANRFRKNGMSWSRVLHVYTSMASLLLVLFFALTGITLNHPEWTFGLDGSVSVAEGSLPVDVVSSDGVVDFLTISEFLRDAEDIRGTVTDHGLDGTDGYIVYNGPGYDAAVSLDLSDGTYSVTETQDGLIAVMNDLHKGRDTGASWSWLIDLSGGFLALVAVTGLVLQLFLSKRRKAALWTVAGGLAVMAVLWVVAVS